MSIQDVGLTVRPMTEAEAVDRARVLKALADPVRLRIVAEIAGRSGGRACVCDLAAPFDLTQPTISHHLKVLRDAGIVTSERRGTWVYYTVDGAVLTALGELLGRFGAVSGEPTTCEVDA